MTLLLLLLNSRRKQFVLFPTLPGFIDALIGSWLEYPVEDSTLAAHLACRISYLYEYVQPVKEGSFAKQLKYEHRQYHFDTLAGMMAGDLC